jgi:lipoate-protein ligase A
MAIDEAMLDMVASGELPAAFRTYGWSVPTLSLGYFQRYDDRLNDPRLATQPIVRRPTGGGALWHDQELTYAVVVPEHHPLARPSYRLYETVHMAIASLLQSFAIPVRRRADLPEVPLEGPKPFLCFHDHDDNDLLLTGHKIVGSAQRRRRGAVLQHGSILLWHSKTTPELVGVLDLLPPLGVVPIPLRIGPAIFDSLDLLPVAIRVEAQQRVDTLALHYETERYRTSEWTQKR